MLYCNVDDVEPGMVLGASVANPQAPWVELLKPGVVLDASMLARLRSKGVVSVWVEHDLTRDLDAAVSPQLSAARMAVYSQLKESFRAVSSQTVAAVPVQQYRQSVMQLVLQLMADQQFASLTDQLFAAGRDVFTHSANVSYLSLLVGLQLQSYVVKERSRLSPDHARDLTSLGVGAMLHDVGKAAGGAQMEAHHEINLDQKPLTPEVLKEYHDHTLKGYQLLRNTQAMPSAKQVVLNHHQRFDGQGWPAMSVSTGKTWHGPQVGSQIHIFSRIAAAANVLDNLLFDAAGQSRPPVAGLCEFAGERFDGWFDPVVRRMMLRRIPPFALGSKIRLSDGREAVVSALNLVQPCRPKVRFLGASGAGSARKSAPASGASPGPSGAALDFEMPADVHIAFYAGVDVSSWRYEIPGAISEVKAEAEAEMESSAASASSECAAMSSPASESESAK